jgi:hypothetical protein
MTKPNLKLVEPSLQDQLEAAIAAEAEATEKWRSAESQFVKKYPGDHRLISTKAGWQPERIEFYNDQREVLTLKSEAHAAKRAVDQARSRIVTNVTGKERRAELAAAIDEIKKVDVAVGKLRAAVARAASAVADAEEIHGDAAKAVTAATEAHARTFEAALEQGHPVGRDSSVRDARRKADEAADELASARTAAAGLKGKLSDAEQTLREAHGAVRVCAQNVALVELPKLLAEAQSLRAELEAQRQVLWLLNLIIHRRVIDGTGWQSDVDDFLASPVLPFEHNGGEPEEHPAAAPWLEAIEALTRDAAAPLPKV